MKFRVEVICVNDEGVEQRQDVMEMERQELAMETLGWSLVGGKALLQGVQAFVASQQLCEDLKRRRRCPRTAVRGATATWPKGRTSPERLYLDVNWGSLMPYEKVADLLKEVLPVSESTNHEIVREHLQAVAERMEAELGEERRPDPVKPEENPSCPCPMAR